MGLMAKEHHADKLRKSKDEFEEAFESFGTDLSNGITKKMLKDTMARYGEVSTVIFLTIVFRNFQSNRSICWQK